MTGTGKQTELGNNPGSDSLTFLSLLLNFPKGIIPLPFPAVINKVKCLPHRSHSKIAGFLLENRDTQLLRMDIAFKTKKGNFSLPGA